MKVLIPVAGAGTRFRPHTYTQPKSLIPVAGKPILAHIIDALVKAKFTEFVLVIGYLGEKIMQFMHEKYPTLPVTFVEQPQREGLGHAVWTARETFRHEKNIFIALGDTVFDIDVDLMLETPESCLGVKEVRNPREFGIVELDSAGFVKKLIEKPKIPHSNLAIVGLYKIKEVEALLSALEYNIMNNIQTLGEFQLADALQRMIESGVKISTITVNNWFDCGKKEVLLETNAMLLQRDHLYSVDLPAYDNTIIVHPVCIGTGCTIDNSIIGPYVTIGDNSVIMSSIIKDSIVGNFSNLKDIVVSHSIIGSDTAITGVTRQLNIGDNAEINFS